MPKPLGVEPVRISEHVRVVVGFPQADPDERVLRDQVAVEDDLARNATHQPLALVGPEHLQNERLGRRHRRTGGGHSRLIGDPGKGIRIRRRIAEQPPEEHLDVLTSHLDHVDQVAEHGLVDIAVDGELSEHALGGD